MHDTPFATPDLDPAMNKGVNPIFFVEPVENPAKSVVEGRPIFDELERVRIMVVGDPFTASVQPVTQEVKDRFPLQYLAFERQKTERLVTGTPITEWPVITRARASELHALDIFSVENLGSVSDANIARLGPDGRGLRAKALAYLSAAKDGAALAGLAQENCRLKADLDDLRDQMSAMAVRLSAAEEMAANLQEPVGAGADASASAQESIRRAAGRRKADAA